MGAGGVRGTCAGGTPGGVFGTLRDGGGRLARGDVRAGVRDEDLVAFC